MSLILETKRLTLRPFDQGDMQAVITISTNPCVSRYMQDMIYPTEQEASVWISMLARLYDPAAPFIVLAIVPKGNLEPVGYIGLHPKEELDNAVEILYAVANDMQNQGYATEAAVALIHWCFETTDTPFISAIVKPDNIPSARVVQKLGFEQHGEATIPYNGKETLFHYYRLTSPTRQKYAT